jgi:hypothetical protein
VFFLRDKRTSVRFTRNRRLIDAQTDSFKRQLHASGRLESDLQPWGALNPVLNDFERDPGEIGALQFRIFFSIFSVCSTFECNPQHFVSVKSK